MEHGMHIIQVVSLVTDTRDITEQRAPNRCETTLLCLPLAEEAALVAASKRLPWQNSSLKSSSIQPREKKKKFTSQAPASWKCTEQSILHDKADDSDRYLILIFLREISFRSNGVREWREREKEVSDNITVLNSNL